MDTLSSNNNEELKIYRYNDDISFRVCQLSHSSSLTRKDCTQFEAREENFRTRYYCNQEGIHFHCTKHPAIELEYEQEGRFESFLICNKCKIKVDIASRNDLISKCLKMLNYEKFKDAKLIRLDDWYYPEIKYEKIEASDYWVRAYVKTDKDDDTIIVLYIGKKGSKEKAQYFIKPEKLQLTSDHKDLDPATILSKIEVTFKDRLLKQDYDI